MENNIKNFKKYLNESFVKNNINSIKSGLVDDKISWDNDVNGIHFRNGRFNLETGKLEKRTTDYYITKYTDRDY